MLPERSATDQKAIWPFVSGEHGKVDGKWRDPGWGVAEKLRATLDECWQTLERQYGERRTSQSSTPSHLSVPPTTSSSEADSDVDGEDFAF